MYIVEDWDSVNCVEKHRACKYCEYDLFGQPINLRNNPFMPRMGRCVRCPECGRVNFLDRPNIRDEIRGWRAIYWLLIGALIIFTATMIALVLTGQILDFLNI